MHIHRYPSTVRIAFKGAGSKKGQYVKKSIIKKKKNMNPT